MQNLKVICRTAVLLLVYISLTAGHCTLHCHCNSAEKVSCFDMSEDLTFFEKLYGTFPLTDITISRSSLPELPERVFQDMNIKTLTLAGNGITVVHRRAFNSLHNLRFLYLENNNIHFLHRETFSGNVELVTLNLNYNELQDTSAFCNISSLKHLYLKGNAVSTLRNESFMNLELLTLVLSDNEISVVEALTFSNLQSLQEIDLSNNHLKHIPEGAFQENWNLSELVVRRNQLSDIEFVRNITNLRYLYLQENSVTLLKDDAFYGTCELYRVNLSRNKIKTIESRAFAGLKELEDLDLSWNQITTLDENTFLETPQLQRLNLAHNRISQVGFSRASKSLTHLYLSHNTIRSLEAKAFSATGGFLQSLDLSFNPLRSLPQSTLHGLFSLSFLNISHTGLTDLLPNVLTSLPALNIVDFSGNRLMDVEAIRSISNLRYLQLRDNILTALLNNFFLNLTHEHISLDISRNALVSVERDAFRGLDEVHSICLSRNTITSLHKNTFDFIPSFWKMDVSRNKISELDFIRNVTSVRHLHMAYNSVEKLPKLAFSSSKISLLHYIDVSNNRIHEIHRDAFQNLKNIWDLNLSKNNLSFLHENTFANTTSLWELNLSFNKLTEMSSFSNIPSLRRLNISRNKIHVLPDSTFTKSNMTMLRTIDLSRNMVKLIEKLAFDGLIQLEHLNLSGNYIDEIDPHIFQKNIELINLDLSDNNLTDLKFIIPSLITCDISRNAITNLTSELIFPRIKVFNLARNKIVTVTATSMKYLLHLEDLNLSNNNIELLEGNTFQSSISLIKLDLSGNQLKHLGAIYAPSLKYLTLASNKLNSLSNSTLVTTNISHLIYLDISNNSISYIEAYSLSTLPFLKYLGLSNNNISDISTNTFRNNTLLDTVDLSYNNIVRLNVFRDHVSLHALNVSNNLITIVPDKAFSKSKNSRLTHLDLSSNAITHIKNKAFSGMVKLKYLDISNNMIPRLYSGFLTDVPRLHTMRYFNNPLSKDIATVAGRNRTLSHTQERFNYQVELGHELHTLALERRILRCWDTS